MKDFLLFYQLIDFFLALTKIKSFFYQIEKINFSDYNFFKKEDFLLGSININLVMNNELYCYEIFYLIKEANLIRLISYYFI